MQITATRSTLQAALAQAVSVTPSRTALPILGHVLIEAGEGLTLSATDLDRALVVRTRAEIIEPGRVCVPAKTLAELTKTLPDKPIRLQRTGSQLVVSAGRTVARLPIAEADDFPTLPAVEMADAVEIESADLVGLIQRTAFAVSEEESRPILNGGLIHAPNGRLRVVATNGHRLAAVYGPDAPESWPEDGIILHRAGLAMIERTLRGHEGPVRLAVGTSHLALATDDLTLYSRLVEGPYPRYEQVIPKEHTTQATVDRAALLSAIRRAMVVADSTSYRLRLEWSEAGVQIMVQTSDTGSMDEMVEAQVDGPVLAIGFNGAYLVEILSAIATDEVEIRMSTPERAAVVVPVGDPDALYLCMPLRLLD